jgi:hypothetical protein
LKGVDDALEFAHDALNLGKILLNAQRKPQALPGGLARLHGGDDVGGIR